MLEGVKGPVNRCEGGLLGRLPSASLEDKKAVAYFESSALNWQTMYHRQDLWGEIHQQRLARFLAWIDKLKLPTDRQVLEVGCGAGLATVALAKRGYFVEAVDAAAPMIELARQNAAEAGVGSRVNANLGDVYHLAFSDEAFGLVLSIGVIPWLQSPAQAITELARVLKPGGYLLLTADNRWRLALLLDPVTSPFLAWTRQTLKKILGIASQPAPMANVVRSYQHSLSEVDAFFAGAGLERVRTETLGFGPFTFFYRKVLPEWLGVAVHRVLQRFVDMRCPVLRSTGAQFLVLARKRPQNARSGGLQENQA